MRRMCESCCESCGLLQARAQAARQAGTHTCIFMGETCHQHGSFVCLWCHKLDGHLWLLVCVHACVSVFLCVREMGNRAPIADVVLFCVSGGLWWLFVCVRVCVPVHIGCAEPALRLASTHYDVLRSMKCGRCSARVTIVEFMFCWSLCGGNISYCCQKSTHYICDCKAHMYLLSSLVLHSM